MTLDAWGEIDALTVLLDEFAGTATGEYFGVDAMRMSLENRRSDLVSEIFDHQRPVREHLDLILTGGAASSRGVRVTVLADLLEEVQEALAGIGTAIARGPRRVRVSAQMRALVGMRVSFALPGSLAVRLVPADASLAEASVDLFGEQPSVLEESVDRLLQFFTELDEGELGEEEDRALGAVSEMGPRGAARVRSLAGVIANAGVETEWRWRSPRLARDAQMTSATARRLNDFMATLERSEHRVVYEGRLMGLSLLRHRFELVLAGNQTIAGSVEEGLLDVLPEFLGGSTCRAEVVISVVSTPGGLTKQSRTLVAMSPLASGS